MIEVMVKLEENEASSLTDVKHSNTLRIHGVPMRGNSLVQGVESGVLTYSDEFGVRTYTWLSEAPAKPKKRFLDHFKRQFRIRRFESLGETWYEVQEKRWYWPVWDSWTMCTLNRGVDTIKYPSLYIAQRAVSFYLRSEEPCNSVVSQL